MATTKTTKVLPVRQPLKREPTHPGEILREDVLPALRMNVSQAARELGVSRQLLHRILAGRAPVTPEMAVRLGKWAGNGPALWLGMQQAFDVGLPDADFEIEIVLRIMRRCRLRMRRHKDETEEKRGDSSKAVHRCAPRI